MFHQDSVFKFSWDIVMAFLLCAICIVMPVHIAFKSETHAWCKIYLGFDFMFLLDMIFTFFTSLPQKKIDEEVIDEITDRKQIAERYFKSWFPIELLAILPIDFIMSAFMGHPKLCDLYEDDHEHD